MIRLLFAFLMAISAPFSSAVFAQEVATAHWSGTVELPGGEELEFSVELDKDSGTISIPQQNVKDLALADVSVSDKELKFSVAEVNAVWEMKVAADGKTAEGVLRQGLELRTTMTRLDSKKELHRPQEPKAPFPYESLEVSFENKTANVRLAGTLTLPKGNGPFPCAVMVTGSGAQDRDEALLGHKPFLIVADHLARHGVAVLRYDDRGVAKSTGNFAEATSDDFAADALAAVAFLKSRKEILANQIGIIGHSEGGLIAPMCASQSKDVAFIVMLAGTGISGAELLPIQTRLINIAGGMEPGEADLQFKEQTAILKLVTTGRTEQELKEAIHAAAIRQLRAEPETKDWPADKLDATATQVATDQCKQMSSPWFKHFLTLDPRANLVKVKCPVLALNGEKDLQVPPKQNLPEIKKALEAGGNKDVTIVEFPNLNHLFQTCKSGSPDEYGQIEETIAPPVLESMTAWIRKRCALDR